MSDNPSLPYHPTLGRGTKNKMEFKPYIYLQSPSNCGSRSEARLKKSHLQWCDRGALLHVLSILMWHLLIWQAGVWNILQRSSCLSKRHINVQLLICTSALSTSTIMDTVKTYLGASNAFTWKWCRKVKSAKTCYLL